MEFCADCGSILKPIKVNSGKQVMFMLAYTKCGHKKQDSDFNGKVKGKLSSTAQNSSSQ